MGKSKLLYLLSILFIIAFIPTACDNDDDWQPIWGIPIIKEFELSISDFLREIGDQSRQEVLDSWNDYVEADETTDEQIDSIAYETLISSNLVTFDSTGVPTLNDEAKTSLENNPVAIAEINDFLKDYYEKNPGAVLSSGYRKNLTHSPLLEEDDGSTGSGKNAIKSLINDINSIETILIVGSSVLENIPLEYTDSLNSKLNSIAEFNISDSIQMSLSGLIEDLNNIVNVQVNLNVKSTLPVTTKFDVELLDESQTPIYSLFDDETIPMDENTLNIYRMTIDNLNLRNVFNGTKFASFHVDKKENFKITANELRNLSKRSIKISLFIDIQTRMSRLVK
jgi:hypothetical protein